MMIVGRLLFLRCSRNPGGIPKRAAFRMCNTQIKAKCWNWSICTLSVLLHPWQIEDDTIYGQTELVATMRMQSWVQNSVQKSVHSSVHSPVPSPESRFYTNPGEHMLALWHTSQGTIIESISLVLWIVCSSVMHSACHRCSYCWEIVCFVALKPFLLNLKHACCRHLYFCKVWNGY